MFIHVHPDFLYPGWNVAAFSNSAQNLDEIKDWCYNTYGESNYDAGWIDLIKHGEVVFKRDSDLNLFLLRWSK